MSWFGIFCWSICKNKQTNAWLFVGAWWLLPWWSICYSRIVEWSHNGPTWQWVGSNIDFFLSFLLGAVSDWWICPWPKNRLKKPVNLFSKWRICEEMEWPFAKAYLDEHWFDWQSKKWHSNRLENHRQKVVDNLNIHWFLEPHQPKRQSVAHYGMTIRLISIDEWWTIDKSWQFMHGMKQHNILCHWFRGGYFMHNGK